ncbi:MAG: oxygen-independent coproporphyrinogen III oxidase [bacterium]|nr:oxygen-independent coproporphyrinogen III oxidase [bacterium]
MSSLAVSPDLLTRYATNAPRYTSYPTAIDWDRDFDASIYGDRLERAGTRNDPLSVYFHLPFCQELCLFCGCNVVITRKEERIEAYLQRLMREIEFVAARGLGQRPVRQYHWGGGTPTHLSLDQIERLQTAFLTAFQLAPDAEVAIEVDPRVTTVEQIELLARVGFNRVSMGVQDFDPVVQKHIKRVQSEEETRAIVDAARENGMESVNIDLMYGLPHQSAAAFARTIETVLDMRPERVALFHYAHVPWMKKHQTAMDEDAIPEAGAKIGIFLDALEAFQSAGYRHIGLDHFALPDDELSVAASKGELQRNFMGYTTRRGTDMVSLGSSAIGEVDGCFFQNDPNERQYNERIDEHGFASIRGHEMSVDDRLRRDVILSLMCNGLIDKRAIGGTYGLDFDATFAGELGELAPMVADGLVELDADVVRLTAMGQLFMRNVALPFDRYFRLRAERGETGRGTFSKTL